MPNLLITGAGQRIGAAIARRFAQAGYSVAIHYRHSAEETDRLLAELPPGSNGIPHQKIQADFLSAEETAALLPRLIQGGFRPDVLINSAARYSRTPLEKISPEEIHRLYRVNFLAPMELMQQFRSLVARGAILNLLDQRVFTTDSDAGIYGLSKKSLRDFTELCAVRWAPDIRVNGIAPGIVLPPPGGSMEKMQNILRRIPLQQRTTEEEIANAALFLTESPTITGAILPVDGGLHLAPPAESSPAG